jgi:hypothetical protein
MLPRASAPILLLALISASPARAQDPSVDVRGFRASADAGAGLYLEPAASPATGDWNAALWLSYAYHPITLKDPATDEVRFDVLSHQISADLATSIGLGERAALGFDLPLVVYQTGDEPTDASRRALGGTALPGQALGDLGLDGKLTLVRPTRGEFGGFALALHERFTLPTGDEASYVGEGNVTSETRLLLEYRLVALGLHFAAGAKLRAAEARVACADLAAAPDAADPCPTRFGHEIPFGLGLSVRPQAFGLDDEGRMTLYLETHGYVPIAPVAPFESSRVAAAQLGLGARYALGDVSVFGGVETALAGGVGNPPLRVVASLLWSPRVHDVDGDGIEDAQDQCRELAEDHDRFQDDDGCPEGDNDEDGVVDDEDRCPAGKEDEDLFEDEDGCPDLDNDGDGIPDDRDGCPDEPGPASATPAKNGCVVRDTDADGIEGEQDRCPDQPEDRDGHQDGDGCPDPDNDGDGIPDGSDACRDLKGVDSDDPKEKGCPDPDPDKDTVLGQADKCPDRAEVWNGLDDADGCPDDDPKKKLLVTVKEAGPAVELLAAVKLTDAGEVDPASAPLLAALASELKGRPDWSIRVGVRPSPKTREEGSKKRAEAVLAELRRLSRRKDVGEAAPWAEVKDAPRAEVHGIGFKIKVNRAAKP